MATILRIFACAKAAIAVTNRALDEKATLDEIDGAIRDADRAQRAIGVHIGTLQDRKRTIKAPS